MSNPNLSIVLSIYNDEDNIKILIPEIERTFSCINYEKIIVNDSSPNGTTMEAEYLREKYDNIKIIVRKKKEGVGVTI